MPCLSFAEVSQRQQRILWPPTRPTTVWAPWQAADARDKGGSESADAIRGLVGGFHAARQGYRSCTGYWLSEVAKTWDLGTDRQGCAESHLLVVLLVLLFADPPNHCNQTTSILSKAVVNESLPPLFSQFDLSRHGCILMYHYHVDIRGLQKRATTSSRDPTDARI